MTGRADGEADSGSRAAANARLVRVHACACAEALGCCVGSRHGGSDAPC